MASSAISLADFGIHTRTGFVSPQAPISRLPAEWELWESILEEATQSKLQLGAALKITEEEKAISESWRAEVGQLPILSITNLKGSESLLSHAHSVLAYLVHFYVHSLPPEAEARIPPSLSLPFLQVSAELDVPPVMTYNDDIMTNWTLREQESDGVPTTSNLRSQWSFTGSTDEEVFYLSPVYVELRGAEALRLIQEALYDISRGGEDTVARVTNALEQLIPVLRAMKEALVSVRDGCNPDFFYRNLRPWLIGGDSDPNRKWIFEGIERDPSLKEPVFLSGSSAAQSPLIQALDGLLGIEAKQSTSSGTNSGSITQSTPFAHRMRVYMTRRQRELMVHLTASGSVLREFVTSTNDAKLSEAYNSSLVALKEFRDGHMIIVTLYIIQPSKRLAKEEAERNGQEVVAKELKGSAGGDLARLLKDFRESTTSALLPTSS